MNLYKKSDAEIVKHINLIMKDTWSELPKWRREAREMYNFEAGEQWNEDDKTALAEQNRPAVTFNRVAKVIDAASGNELVSRQEARYLPRNATDTDAVQAEVWNAAAKYFRDHCNAEDEESDAFRDTLICGMGWTETKVDFSEDPDGMIVIERVDPLEMRWDLGSKRRNLVDSKFRLREKWVPGDEVRRQWPKANLGMEDLTYLDELWMEEPHDADNAWKYEGLDAGTYARGYNPATKEYRIIFLEWWEYENYNRYVTVDGTLEETDDQNRIVRDSFGEPRAVKQRRKRFYRAVVGGQSLLEKGEILGNDWTYHCITGKRMRRGNSTTWFGLMKPMKDPQMYANKFMSQMMHVWNSNTKGGFFYETNALADPVKAREDLSRPEGMVELNPGGLAKVQERAQFQVPANLDRLMQYAISAIPDVSGVNLEFMGLANREQAGVTEHARARAAFGILAVLYDALRLYRKIQGKYMLVIMSKYLADGRLIRIMGPEGPAFVRMTKQQGDPKYDVVIDDQPSSPNEKMEVWQLMTQLLPVFKDQGVPVVPELLDYLPLPASLTMKWKQKINDPRVQQLTQAVQALQAENEELKLKRDERMAREKTRQVGTVLEDQRDKARIEIEQENAVTERIEALSKAKQANQPVNNNASQ